MCVKKKSIFAIAIIYLYHGFICCEIKEVALYIKESVC